MVYLSHIIILTCIYAVLAVSLDLVVGKAGMLSVAHSVFYGIGAYSSALLTSAIGVPFPIAVLAGMAVASVASFLISLPAMRLQEDYFVIATFGFQLISFNILNNWLEVTRGPLGINSIPRPDLFGWRLDSDIGYVLLALCLLVITFFIALKVSGSPFGRVLRAIREDEVFTKSLGKNTFYFKVSTLAVSAALAAAAGSLYAHYVTYIDPTNFTVLESILILSMVIIGGADSKWGPLLGAAVLVAIPEALRFLGLPLETAANLRQVIYGIALIILMMIRPRGLVGNYNFSGRT